MSILKVCYVEKENTHALICNFSLNRRTLLEAGNECHF